MLVNYFLIKQCCATFCVVKETETIIVLHSLFTDLSIMCWLLLVLPVVSYFMCAPGAVVFMLE